MTHPAADIVADLASSVARSAAMAVFAQLSYRDIAETMIAELSAPTARRQMTSEWRIRDRAYFLWLEAGRPAGRALDFWLIAEREFHQRIVDSARTFWSGYTGRDAVSSTIDVRQAA